MDLLNLTGNEWALVFLAGIFAVGLGTFAVIVYALATTKRPGADGGSGAHPILERLAREPALLSGFVSAAAALIASFGFELSSQQTGAIMAFLVAGLAILVRSQVTPVRKLNE